MRRPALPGLRLLALALTLVCLASLPYLVQSRLRSFINLDDPAYVYENPAVREGITLDGVRWAFGTFHTGNWHPLTWISHMLDVSLFRTEAWGHHLSNILLHTANTVLLFSVLVRLCGALWPSWVVAAFFGAHPLRVESVAWVSERKDVLSALIFLFVLLAYERYARRGGTQRYLLVVLLLAMGLMAKPMLVTTPLVLLLLDLWPLGRWRAVAPADGCRWASPGQIRLLTEKVPLLTLSAAASLVTYLAQRNTAPERMLLSLGTRLANAVLAYGSYLGKTVWPMSLAVYYPHPGNTISWWRVVPCFLLLTGISVAVVRRRKKQPALLVGWLWFVGMLVPAIGLIQVGEQAMADRYTYLPGIGLALLLMWGLREAYRALNLRTTIPALGVCLVLGALSGVTVGQVRQWKDQETLFRHTLVLTSGNWVIHNNLGLHLRNQGRREEAILQLQEAVRLRPLYPDPHHNLGAALADSGRYPEAIAQFQEAIALRPDNAEAMNSLGVTLLKTGRLDEGISRILNALRIRSDFPEAHNNLGMALDSLGRREEAIRHYREALRLRPTFPEALYNLAQEYHGLGRLDEAVVFYQKTLRLRPDHVETHERLGMILMSLGRRQEAESHLAEARRLRMR